MCSVNILTVWRTGFLGCMTQNCVTWLYTCSATYMGNFKHKIVHITLIVNCFFIFSNKLYLLKSDLSQENVVCLLNISLLHHILLFLCFYRWLGLLMTPNCVILLWEKTWYDLKYQWRMMCRTTQLGCLMPCSGNTLCYCCCQYF